MKVIFQNLDDVKLFFYKFSIVDIKNFNSAFYLSGSQEIELSEKVTSEEAYSGVGKTN